MPELKNCLFSFPLTFKARYVFIFVFVVCTIFFIFNNPSIDHSSIWFKNILKTRSHFSSFFSHFFPNSTSSIYTSQNTQFSGKMNSLYDTRNGPSSSHDKTKNSETNVMVKGDSKRSDRNENSGNGTMNSPGPSVKKGGIEGAVDKNITVNSWFHSVKNGDTEGAVDKSTMGNSSSHSVKNDASMKGVREENVMRNHTVLLKKDRDGAGVSMEKQRKENSVDMTNHCNIFDGRWVRDESYPLYEAGSCPHIDEPFNCFLNGRRDNGYEKFRWQPKDCNIPRLNARNMLELLRGKRLVYVGDSLNRNMWESMVCLLRNSVQDKSKVFEASGRQKFRTEGSYSFLLTDYNCSVEFFRSPFLVQEWEIMDTNGSKKETLRLDLIEKSCERYKSADVIVFNTGHWWTHEKTSAGKGYYQEGSNVYGELNVVEAFRKAMTTWARWIDANINPMKTLVVFRGYSASHFSGGQWNSGGQCDGETEPIKDKGYPSQYLPIMGMLERVLKAMKTPVFYLNITRMTDFRKDAHPSVYRNQNLTEEEIRSLLMYQDCSHWCLPGVPDTWNEILYAHLLIKHNQKQHQQQHKVQQQKEP